VEGEAYSLWEGVVLQEGRTKMQSTGAAVTWLNLRDGEGVSEGWTWTWVEVHLASLYQIQKLFQATRPLYMCHSGSVSLTNTWHHLPHDSEFLLLWFYRWTNVASVKKYGLGHKFWTHVCMYQEPECEPCSVADQWVLCRSSCGAGTRVSLAHVDFPRRNLHVFIFHKVPSLQSGTQWTPNKSYPESCYFLLSPVGLFSFSSALLKLPWPLSL
jgi:hypothetical protein